jgi:hypothetical protein
VKLLRFRSQPWHLAALLIAICIGVIAFMYLTRSRGLDDPREMLACLPRTGATVLYVDVNALRRSGILDLIAGSKAAEEIEYREFVAGTGFDYRRDLNSVAAAIAGDNVWFVLRGRFDWRKLKKYVNTHGGSCNYAFCRVESSPNRFVSFYALRANVMALATSRSDSAAYDIGSRPGVAQTIEIPPRPVWISVPAAALSGAEKLPPGAKSFVSPLASAEKVVFSMGPADGRLELSVDVTCASPSAASDLLVQLESATNRLRKLLEREKQKPNPADLSGVLVSGVFRREDRHVLGAWPVARAFIESIAGSNFN